MGSAIAPLALGAAGWVDQKLRPDSQRSIEERKRDLELEQMVHQRNEDRVTHDALAGAHEPAPALDVGGVPQRGRRALPGPYGFSGNSFLARQSALMRKR